MRQSQTSCQKAAIDRPNSIRGQIRYAQRITSEILNTQFEHLWVSVHNTNDWMIRLKLFKDIAMNSCAQLN